MPTTQQPPPGDPTGAAIKLRIAIPVWGERYIEILTSATIPALLAPGNVPAFAREGLVEFVFLTKSASEAEILGHPVIAKLAPYATLRTLHIDQYFPSDYGWILTNAYYDAIRKFPDDATQFHYMFLNVDSILSDGALTTIARYIKAGKSHLYCPGIRVDDAAFLDDLKAGAFELDGVLSVPSRELARLALRHLHRTVLAQSRSQHAAHLKRPYQMYWMERAGCMFTAQFLMANICFRPEIVPAEAVNFIDYCIAEIFCPSQPIEVIRDSDELLLVEPQIPIWMQNEICLGTPTESDMVEFFGHWTTRQHIALGQNVCVVHTRDLDAQDDALLGQIQGDVRAFAAKLRPQPVVDHPYWTAAAAGRRAAAAAAAERARAGIVDKVVIPFGHGNAVRRVENFEMLRSNREKLLIRWFGEGVNPSPLHPMRKHYAPVLAYLGDESARGRVAFVAESTNTWFLPKDMDDLRVHAFLTAEQLITALREGTQDGAETALADAAAADIVLFRFQASDVLELKSIVDLVARRPIGKRSVGITFSTNLAYSMPFVLPTIYETLWAHPDIDASVEVVGALPGSYARMLMSEAIESHQAGRKGWAALFAASSVFFWLAGFVELLRPVRYGMPYHIRTKHNERDHGATIFIELRRKIPNADAERSPA